MAIGNCQKIVFLSKIEKRRNLPAAEFKEFEPRLEFETRLKYGWFHLKLYSMFQDLSRRSIETGFWRISDDAQIH